MPSRDERRLLAEVARLFYVQGVNKVDIGQQLNLSRFKVARMLEEARDAGIVSISIHGAAPIDLTLSRQLSEHWGIHAVVSNSLDGTPENVRRSVGQAAAELFQDVVSEGEIVGLTWGRTLTAMTDYLTRMPKLSIVQLTGAVTSDINDSPVELVRRACLSTGGTAFPIFAPAIVDDAAALAALKDHPDVKAAVDLFDHITTAFLAVGSWDREGSQIFAILPDEDSERLRQMGVIAEVSGVFFDGDGRIVAHDLTGRYLSISAQQIQRTPRVVAAVGGIGKMEATRSVIRSGLVTDLVTDNTLAEAAFEQPPIVPRADPDRS